MSDDKYYRFLSTNECTTEVSIGATNVEIWVTHGDKQRRKFTLPLHQFAFLAFEYINKHGVPTEYDTMSPTLKG